MSNKDVIEMHGVVKECYPNTTFLVECENGHELLAYLAGKMRRYYIRVLPGDHVVVAISPYDLSKGRITRRLKEAPKKASPSESNDGEGDASSSEGKSDS